MNQGIVIFPLPPSSLLYLLYKTEIINVNGIIHNALINFVVVAICSANSLLSAAAPTTDEVSCIAIAHQYPNSVSLIPNKFPSNGNINNAMAFNAKIVPSATVISLSFALITGAIAAIALPPHIAVPPDTNVRVPTFTFSNLPIHKPNPIVRAIENIVNTKPVFPASIASVKFMPNPNPTTDA